MFYAKEVCKRIVAIFQQIGTQTSGFTCAISLEFLPKMNAASISSSATPPGGATLASALTEMETSGSHSSNTKIAKMTPAE